MIYKASRIELRDEGARQGYMRALDIVGVNVAGSISGDVGTLTYSGREVLTAARTYYVRTDGSDSNTGLVNSAGGAFATIAKAVSVIGGLDLSVYNATIQLGNTGNYAGATISAPFVGGPGSLVALAGDSAAPGSYVITSTLTLGSSRLFLSGVDFTPSSGDGLVLDADSYAQIFGACHFGTTTGSRQILVEDRSALSFQAVCTINGNAANWILGVGNATVGSNGLAHVFSGTPAFSVATVQGQTGAVITIANATLSGAATGKRYDATLNAVIYTNGGGANYFPGNSAGTATTGLYA